MMPIGLTKVLWMLIVINGHVAGVFLDQPMPDYMTMQECEASALMHSHAPEAIRQKAVYKCVWAYGRPLNTGPYWSPLE